MRGSPLERLDYVAFAIRWYLSGEAAELVAERYEDMVDAVLYPVLSAGLAVAALYVVDVMVSRGGFGDLLVAIGFMVVAVTFVDRTAVAILASKYYATEWTADVPRPEVSR